MDRGQEARHPADEWSDLDLILFVDHPWAFVDHPDWLSEIGEVWLRVLKVTGEGDPEWLVLFAEGLKVDFLFTTAVGSPLRQLAGPFFGTASRRGARMVVAKVLEDQPVHFSTQDDWQPPGPAEFMAEVQALWMTAYRVGVLLRRGELWRARMLMDSVLRQGLEKMITWHARAKYGAEYDTWHDGRFLMEWADPDVVAGLAALFAGYDLEASKRALLAHVGLYANLTGETASIWKYPIPVTPLSKVQDWIGVLTDSGA